MWQFYARLLSVIILPLLRVSSAATHNVGSHKLSWHLILFHGQFPGTLLTWKSWGFLWSPAKLVCGCDAYLQTGILPKGGSCHGANANPRHMAEISTVDVELLKMNLENIVPQEGFFEGWLSVILGWGNWKALDRSPWSQLTFIKGFGLHRKIEGLLLSVCRLWCWISHGLRTQKALLPFKAILVRMLQGSKSEISMWPYKMHNSLPHSYKRIVSNNEIYSSKLD